MTGAVSEQWVARVKRSLIDASSVQNDPNRTESRKHVQWLKAAFNFLIKMNQVNPAGEDGFGPSVKRCDLPLWSKFAEIFTLYFAVKLIVGELAQHEYDRLSFDIDALNRSSSCSAEKYAKLSEDLRRINGRLDMIGSPWREIRYPVELIYLFEVALSYVAYIGFKLFVYRKGPVRLGVLRFLLDEERECANINRDICKQVEEFLVSNENHLWACHSDYYLGGSRNKIGHISGCINEFQEELGSHSSLAKEVLHLLVENCLIPPNRTSKWLSCMQTLACILILLMEMSGLVIGVLFFIVFPKFVMQVPFHSGPADIMFAMEAVIYCTLGLQTCCLYLVLLVVSSVDMVKYALELRKLIRQAIKMTHQIREASFAIQASQHQRAASIRQLNSSLIAILVQFKMFREQLTAIQGIQGLGLSLVMLDMILGPILSRLVAARLDYSSKVIAVPTMLFIMILADLVIGPACYLQARCLDIYRSLASLLANLIATEESCGGKTKTIWSTNGLSFSQSLLQRELSVPEVMVSRFTTKTPFGQVTYSRFLAIHFWCGLLLISLWQSDSSSTGNAIADSLQLF